MPPGFRYAPEFLTEAEERELLARVEKTEWSEVRMHGVIAKRRVAHFGLRYRYEGRKAEEGTPIPEYLLGVRARLAAWAEVRAQDLVEALVTEYAPGAGIGWHRDAPMFGIVVAVSLAGAARMRFRRVQAPSGPKLEAVLEPRSAYLLAGSARWQWQHHIPPTKELRYSVTFRPVRG
jgi:alkylated DNA repair dioxygenase AlkB